MSDREHTNILIAVMGTSPQVLTETLYDLMVQRENPVFIHEIHVLSTVEGIEQINKQLLNSPDGQFCRFHGDYGFMAHEIDARADQDAKEFSGIVRERSLYGIVLMKPYSN